MLRSKSIFLIINRNFSLSKACHTSKPPPKVLGYRERPNEDEITADYIGPPDKKSNIRPILRYIPEHETKLQYALRIRRQEVHEWVDKFWMNHNKRFTTEKEEFITKHKIQGEDSVGADIMSEFYKSFLDKNWKIHVYFNLSWYLKNFELLILALQVNLEKGINRAIGRKIK